MRDLGGTGRTGGRTRADLVSFMLSKSLFIVQVTVSEPYHYSAEQEVLINH